MRISKVCSVAHQTASFGRLAEGIDCRDFVVGRQRNKLHAPVVIQQAGREQERVNWLLRKVCKGRINVTTATGSENLDLLLRGRSRRLNIGEKRLGNGKCWLDKYGETDSSGQ